MKFGLYLEENSIPEWREFYINFELLKQKIKPFVKQYKKKSILPSKIEIENISQPSFKHDPIGSFKLESNLHLKETLLENAPNEEEIHNQRVFKDHIIMELQKVEFFFNENLIYNQGRFEKIKVIPRDYSGTTQPYQI